MIQIRKAQYRDLDQILYLVKELALFEKEPTAVTATLETYQEAWNSKLIDAIVAEENNQVVGMALFYDTFSTWKGRMLYLEDFVVAESHRSRGIGKLIFDELFLEAERRKCILVKWQVLDWNSGAVKFYEKYGATIEKEWWNGKKYLAVHKKKS